MVGAMPRAGRPAPEAAGLERSAARAKLPLAPELRSAGPAHHLWVIRAARIEPEAATRIAGIDRQGGALSFRWKQAEAPVRPVAAAGAGSAAFSDQLIAVLPRLRRFARGLTGTAAEADDLVQAACER